MTASSLRPMRRFSTSSRPAAASNDHPAAVLTRGTGNGHASLPRTSSLRPGPSSASRQPSAAAATNTSRLRRPVAASDVSTRSWPSGPKKATRRRQVVALTVSIERADGVFRRGEDARAGARRGGRAQQQRAARASGDAQRGAACSSWRSSPPPLRPPPELERLRSPRELADRVELPLGVAGEGVRARAAALGAACARRCRAS